MSAGARERYAQLRALAEARPAVTPRTHVAGQVETRWPTVEAAIAYRRWLEAELRELTRAERRALRLLQRDPRTREHPTRSIDFLRIGRAQEKRDRKAQRALENQRRSEAGRKARARQLARPAGSPAEPSAAADAPASDIQEVPCPE